MDEGRVLLIMWDREGLDSVVDATELNREDLFNVLSDNHKLVGQVDSALLKLQLRARFNAHRVCEIYSIKVEEDVTADDMRDWFDTNPQGMADMIRARGQCLWSQSANSNKVVIT